MPLKTNLLRNYVILVLCGVSLSACESSEPKQSSPNFQFTDVTSEFGPSSTPTWKYGGPAIADVNNDGQLDIILTNHHEEPAVMHLASYEGGFLPEGLILRGGDVHGIAPGDYDLDGDVDLLISVGGGNGTTPAPPRLLNNAKGNFTDVTEQSGIAGLGARGRSVRWLDIDLDGDLDFIHITARQIPGETGPRHTIFENLGDGTFTYRASPEFEQIEAERLLVTYLNDDTYLDLVMFQPLSIWHGTGRFDFKNVTKTVLPPHKSELDFVTAASAPDIDNDGDFDLYLSRGKTYYQIANNSLDFNPHTGRIDLRDEGNASQDGFSFKADDQVCLSDFYHWPRGINLTLSVYLGAETTPLDTPLSEVCVTPNEASGFPDTKTESGWYLGHIGGDDWRFEWFLDGNLAWDIRASLSGVSSVQPDWDPQDYNNVPDVLLRNENGTFTDISSELPDEAAFNNWGVIHGDFDNDADQDVFVYRFGKLRERLPDLLLENRNGKFLAHTDHGATNLPSDAHGDMGAVIDFDQDGRLDILSGDDNYGKWHLFKNDLTETGNHIRLSIGYSPSGLDQNGAVIRVKSSDIPERIFTTGSTGAVHSQSLYSNLHIGLGDENYVDIEVTWRDGTQKVLKQVQANKAIYVGEKPSR